MSYIQSVSDGVVLAVRVVPKARKTNVSGIWNESAVKIALAAVPSDNRANEELIEFLSDELKMPKKSLSLIFGLKNRDKKVKITGNSDILQKEIQEWLLKSLTERK